MSNDNGKDQFEFELPSDQGIAGDHKPIENKEFGKLSLLLTSETTEQFKDNVWAEVMDIYWQRGPQVKPFDWDRILLFESLRFVHNGIIEEIKEWLRPQLALIPEIAKGVEVCVDEFGKRRRAFPRQTTMAHYYQTRTRWNYKCAICEDETIADAREFLANAVEHHHIDPGNVDFENTIVIGELCHKKYHSHDRTLAGFKEHFQRMFSTYQLRAKRSL